VKHLKKYDEIVNEGIGDTKSQIFITSLLGLVLAPISLPLFANLPTNEKIQILIKSINKNYIQEKAEYEILDDVKYDIEKPSLINKIFSRLKLIKKKIKKYPTLDDYIKMSFKLIKYSNFLNFKNREDKEYICDKVAEHFARRTEEEWIKLEKKELVFDVKQEKIRKRDHSDVLRQTLQELRELDPIHFDEYFEEERDDEEDRFLEDER
jgi:hypothetical protein